MTISNWYPHPILLINIFIQMNAPHIAMSLEQISLSLPYPLDIFYLSCIAIKGVVSIIKESDKGKNVFSPLLRNQTGHLPIRMTVGVNSRPSKEIDKCSGWKVCKLFSVTRLHKETQQIYSFEPNRSTGVPCRLCKGWLRKPLIGEKEPREKGRKEGGRTCKERGGEEEDYGEKTEEGEYSGPESFWETETSWKDQIKEHLQQEKHISWD